MQNLKNFYSFYFSGMSTQAAIKREKESNKAAVHWIICKQRFLITKKKKTKCANSNARESIRDSNNKSSFWCQNFSILKDRFLC